jgi:hypothetical protein
MHSRVWGAYIAGRANRRCRVPTIHVWTTHPKAQVPMVGHRDRPRQARSSSRFPWRSRPCPWWGVLDGAEAEQEVERLLEKRPIADAGLQQPQAGKVAVRGGVGVDRAALVHHPIAGDRRAGRRSRVGSTAADSTGNRIPRRSSPRERISEFLDRCREALASEESLCRPFSRQKDDQPPKRSDPSSALMLRFVTGPIRA